MYLATINERTSKLTYSKGSIQEGLEKRDRIRKWCNYIYNFQKQIHLFISKLPVVMPAKQICQRGTESCDSYVESENGERQYKLTAGCPRPARAAEMQQQQMKTGKILPWRIKLNIKSTFGDNTSYLVLGKVMRFHWAFLNLLFTASDLEILFLHGHT